MKRRAALAGLTILAVAPLAYADAGKTVPATKVFPFLESMLKLSPAERARIKVTYALRRDGKPAAGVKAALIEASGARTPLPIDDQGRFERLPTLAQLQAKAQLHLDVPADAKFGTAMLLDPVLKPSADYDSHDLVATVEESNSAIRKAAGAMALLAPQMEGLAFQKAESGAAIFPDGSSRPLPSEAGAVLFEPSQFKGAARVRLAKVPTAVDYYDRKK
ncbi:MAG TPA: hypothetical protein VN157_09430 [Caulobacter sp.]|nr:hypothetical protein [Caulobacter sp.]